MPWASPMMALEAPLKFSVKLSAGSASESLTTETKTVFEISPAENVSVPLFAVKSLPPVALPSAVA